MDLERLLADKPDHVARTARDVCRMVAEVVSGAEARVDDDAVSFHLDERFLAVRPGSDHVRLVFSEGSRLDDPHGRLHGDGATRHIEVHRFADLDHEQMVRWLNQAERLASAGRRNA